MRIYKDKNGKVLVSSSTKGIKNLTELDPNKVSTFKLWCKLNKKIINTYEVLAEYANIFDLEGERQ
jgi:hypothetical protein